MKNLLENDFSNIYDNQGKLHAINEMIVTGSFRFCDHYACNSCIPFFSHNCEHETLRFYSNSSVHCLDIESFFNSFRHLSGDRCDKLLYNNQKCVLMDMYCGMSEYLEPHQLEGKIVTGKKEKVRNQIEKTIDRLYSIPSIATFLNNLPEKVGLFGYRSKDDTLFASIPKQISASMNIFLKMAKMQAHRKLSAPMSHGFRFMMCSYPQEYRW